MTKKRFLTRCGRWQTITFYCSLFTIYCLLISCQPQVNVVEVTRVVANEVAPNMVSTPLAAPVVEVTRLATAVSTQVVTVTVPAPVARVGSAERPIQLLFSPVANTAVIANRSTPLVQTLEQATNRTVEIGIVDSEQTIIDLLCAAPADTIGFLSAAGYAQSQAQCGALPSLVAAHADGLTWQAGMIVVRQDSNLTELTDLAGKRWAVPSTTSIAEFLYFQALFAQQGIEIGEIISTPGDTSAMLAVYNGEADFATGTFIPPILPFEERQWQYGSDDPEIWREMGFVPSRSPIGYVVVYGEPEFGGYRIRDARAGVFDTTRGIFVETDILALSAPIPNETVVFGAHFPVSVSRQVVAALTTFVTSDECQISLCSDDFYGWTGVQLADDSLYEPLRLIDSVSGG